jgi:[acyl-carrier-protein] S-malonyltransferase
MPLARTAFVFPGQGSQEVGMGADLHRDSAPVRALFEEADDALGYSLSKIILEGPEEALRQTANTQPAILLVSTALYRTLGLEPSAVAGHSLGEYSALVAAGALRFADTVELVHKRGRYMQEAVPDGKGIMVAVLGAEEETIRAAIAETKDGVVDLANFNAPGNFVLAGSPDATRQVVEKIGGKSRELPVSAPFHSRLMVPAEERLAVDLDQIEIAEPEIPLYNNVEACRVTSAAEIRAGLKRQVSRSVLWTTLVRNMIAAEQIATFVEIGPGKVLNGLIRRIDRTPQRLGVHDGASVEAARTALAG